MKYWLVMPAAGVGRRFGAQHPKQYATLRGRTVIEWALTPFLTDPRCAGVVVALAADDPYWPEIERKVTGTSAQASTQAGQPSAAGPLSAVAASQPSAAQAALSAAEYRRAQGVEAAAGLSGTEPPTRVPLLRADGGAERSGSVRNGLAALAGQANADDWVLVHDAARPCLSARDLARLLDTLETHPVGGLLATPAADTLKRAVVTGAPGQAAVSVAKAHRTPGATAKGDGAPTPSGGYPEVEQTVDRSGLWRALTPQMFRYGRLCEALDRAAASGRYPTDEAQAVEWVGERPVLVEGSASNIKITSADDLVLAEALLGARG